MRGHFFAECSAEGGRATQRTPQNQYQSQSRAGIERLSKIGTHRDYKNGTSSRSDVRRVGIRLPREQSLRRRN